MKSYKKTAVFVIIAAYILSMGAGVGASETGSSADGASAGKARAGRTIIFSDVKATDWFKPYIDKMAEKGICAGYGDGRFRPFDYATHAEASKMIINLIDPSLRKVPELPTGTETVRGYTIPLNNAYSWGVITFKIQLI